LLWFGGKKAHRFPPKTTANPRQARIPHSSQSVAFDCLGIQRVFEYNGDIGGNEVF
jgi:hypothetical protein